MNVDEVVKSRDYTQVFKVRFSDTHMVAVKANHDGFFSRKYVS